MRCKMAIEEDFEAIFTMCHTVHSRQSSAAGHFPCSCRGAQRRAALTDSIRRTRHARSYAFAAFAAFQIVIYV